MKIIAECSINWNTIEEAKEMIRECKRLGLFAAKFQLFSEKEVVNKEHLEYCKERMLTFKQAKSLYDYGVSIGQTVFFTPMAVEFVDWMEKIGCQFYKIRYYDRFNGELLDKISRIIYNDSKGKKKWFISIDEDPLQYYYKVEKLPFFKDIISFPTFNALYCVPSYPAHINSYLCDELFEFGSISDHTSCLRLIMIGKILDFNYIEKHMILDGFQGLENEWAVEFSSLEEVLKK